MFKRVREFFESIVRVTPVMFKDEVLNGLNHVYDLKLYDFENDWTPGTGADTYVSGLNHQWFGNGSVVLGDGIELLTKYNPIEFNGETFEYEVGKIVSKFPMGCGYYSIDIVLPEGSRLNPRIVLSLDNGYEVTLFDGKTDNKGWYKSIESEFLRVKKHKIDGISLNVGFLLKDGKVQLYYNGILVRDIKTPDELVSLARLNECNLIISNECLPEIEGNAVMDDTTMLVKEVTYYKE